ncbi:MAG: hypothetical protein Tp185DCM00d2C31949971_40 [Prokaryotic dsDNA virus sp.]|uniref:hypothetical protein n=2 Tax=Pseudomonadota TaxID=1224 RepID=UPI00118B8E1C|nr:hypothetical protein [Idiomarina sp.]QDP60924.1 MAG: hypothetical protein Tp185DCM00d2C31949971_40 [Prokaryotic dsDNA virus sp.]QDP61806.1 MAG: hypothetical protein Tp1111MES1053591_45 [Prokaryotic dsDNA virus sp.]|tara:strand:+ start:21904 stop:22251 length:348 start_codon:yes stop_codon:yes gene_type:complete
MAGRPTKMTPATVRKLEEAFAYGCTDAEACAYADIAKTTLYEYCEKHPAFTDRKETLKNMPTFKAKRIIYNALDEADLNTAHRVVDRKEGTKVKQEISGEGGGPIKGEWTIKVVG